MGWWSGTPEKHERVSTLIGGQQDILNQLLKALTQSGAGGAFGESADYWRQILEDNPEIMEQFFAPSKRQFEQETIPGLAEQFAGMGSGGLSSSGFRNAGIQAGIDLQERLANIRANLKNQAAAGLTGLGQMGLGNYSQDVVTQQGSPGFFQSIAPGIGAGIGMAVGGPAGAMAGYGAGSSFGKSNPYGGGMRRQGNPY